MADSATEDGMWIAPNMPPQPVERASMEQHPPGHGGSANTPPFPRLNDDSPNTPAEPSSGMARPESHASTPPDSGENLGAAPTGGDADPRPATPRPTPPVEDDVTTAGAAPDAHYLDDDPAFEAEPEDQRAEELDDLYYGEEEPLNEDLEFDRETVTEETRAAASLASRAGARLLLRAETTLQRGAVRMADRLEDTAERLERLAGDRLHGSDSRERAGEAAQSAARWIDDLATYLRDRDAEALREDIEHQVRDRPVQTILLAVAAGWVVGRIMR